MEAPKTESPEERIHYLERRIVKLQQWINDLQSGMYVNCVYCGHRYGPEEDTPVAMADVLKEHIRKCKEHPLFKAEQRIAKLREALKKYGNHRPMCEKSVYSANCDCTCGFDKALKETDNGST